MAAVALLGATSEADQVPARGLASAGLQAVITVAPEVAHGKPLTVGLVLCNVGGSAILIDNWIGNWFVEVALADGRKVTPIRAASILRTRGADPEFLPPGLCWKTDLADLCLVSALPGSTPDWRYEPLWPATYSLRAVFETRFVGDQLAWTGKAISGSAHVVVK